MVVPTFVSQALRNQPITVFGDGLQMRSFCNVRDTIQAMDLLLQNPKSKGAIVNIGNTLETTILDLAKKIKERTHSSSEIVFIPHKEAYGVDFVDVQSRKPNLQKLYQLTSYRPHHSLDSTLDEIISFAKKNL